MFELNAVLILGGYGAVGREAAMALTGYPGTKVIVAGRDPARARPIAGTTTMRVDAADPDDLAQALDGVTTVLMCAEIDNARVARACLERGVNYVDVSASHDLLADIENLDDLARDHGATAALSVGLVPGITNLLARVCAERSPGTEVRVGVLLGSGERHGPAAVAWTLDGLGALEGSWTMGFPAPYGTRTVHRFPFSDQYTLPRTLGVPVARTGLCLDSRLTTGLLAAAGRPAVARLLSRPRVRDLLLRALGKIHLGSEGFAVTVSSGTARASFSGRLQSRATGHTAALLIRDLPALPPGVRHIEQLVDPVTFLTELATGGYVLDLHQGQGF
ncbi:Saccharopine dehydrogenase NADP binding domain-containing protein [Nonomuraea solani]|uniref:Saccharopine dehydrogenase NADP binding domain-containing protein n=1 Tax=Nonomuraea solani TaxID=1144553 RepID=A0A1H6EYV8_9ACTN|nr:saccharopine dehydrogenase NADP-binding domain-containing protein [Nonomuraea solani]SEH02156.1 Saccharopine dehydrogenase NADP binding domain-containing protein [Nonomuraea solani]